MQEQLARAEALQARSRRASSVTTADDRTPTTRRTSTQYQKPATRDVRTSSSARTSRRSRTRSTSSSRPARDFAALAKKYSQDPGSKDKGGKFTANKGSDVPEFDKAVFDPTTKTGVLIEAGEHAAVRLVRDQAARRDQAGEDDAREAGAAAIQQDAHRRAAEDAMTDWMTKTPKSYCKGGKITYQTGYTPTPDPCAHDSTPRTRRPRERAARRRARRAPGADRAPAPRVPVGPRADGAHDRAAHGRGGLRGRRRGARRRRREAARRARRPALPGVLPLAAPVERGAGDLEAVARGVTREARRAPPARLRRRRGGDGRARARELGAAEGRAGGARGRLPRRARDAARRCCSRARCSGARRRSASTTRTSPARSRSSTRSCASCGPSCPARAGGRERARPRASRRSSATCSSPCVNVARRLNVDPELELRAAAERFGARVEDAERLAAADGERLARARPRRAGRVLRPGEGVTRMSRIADVHGRQVLDSRGNPTVEVDVALESGALGPRDRPVGRLDRRARGGRAARRRRRVGRQGRRRRRSRT